LVLLVVVVAPNPMLVVQLVNDGGASTPLTGSPGLPVIGIVPVVFDVLHVTATLPAVNTACAPADRLPAIASPAGSTSTPVPAGHDCANAGLAPSPIVAAIATAARCTSCLRNLPALRSTSGLTLVCIDSMC
jgi:hypothetical protein